MYSGESASCSPFAFLQEAHNAQRELGEGHLSASSDLFVNEISLLY